LTNPALDPFGKIPEFQVLRGQGRTRRKSAPRRSELAVLTASAVGGSGRRPPGSPTIPRAGIAKYSTAHAIRIALMTTK
jgi:hypothetical protein